MIRPADLKDEDIWNILSASREGELEKVKQLISRRPELVHFVYNYTPPIHFAVREGHLDIVRFLLDLGADPTYRTYPFQDSLLTMAQDRGHHEIAEHLLEILSLRFPIMEGLAGFLDAARNGDLARVQSELERNPNLARVSNDTGDTALHQAAAGGHLQIVTALLDAGAHADAVRADGVRPINCALDQGDGKSALLAGVLLERGAAYNIYLAAVLGDGVYVRDALLRDSALSNFEDTSHRRPISAAARRNDLGMVKLLLDHGADPSLPEEGAPLGQALWTAVYQKQHDMAKLLLEHGANPNTAPESSGSVLLHAQKDPELLRMLLKYGAQDNSGDLDSFQRLVSDNALADVERLLIEHPELSRQASAFWGEGILSEPANQGNREMLELLLRHDARVPDVSKWGRYYYFKHDEISALLLQNGMNPNHMNWHHVTLLHDMAQEGDLRKARLLLDYGADINAVDEEYRSTPLGFAARWGQREMVALLLARGADPNKSGAPWATPLAWAQKKGHSDIEADLRRAGAR
ncbi:ankyrin repeat domain-containing protein [Paenibacillus spongiae]|uniref:Ankyrin repeat domain-containing protein n=1 Tax=Paenibacillus spongiae TaxID=2909671 RepID=A0ABY5S5V0_9BACL|nr:ankyrin repeat domain-containing protein [Paenibacillus spongiae]UVI29291.1 ankyrin repeat domain-containing protein [Paenibacillus spongiae]